MPIYTQTYQTWDARFGGGFRWLTVAAQELRVARTSKMYRRLLFLSAVPFLMWLSLLIVTDLMTTNPSALLRSAIQQVQFANVDGRFFRTYISMATPFAFIFCLLVGAGSICNDYRNNLLEVYFAKPLGKLDYFFGKLAAICYYPLLLTAGLSLVLFLLHLLFSPLSAGDFLRELYWVPFSCVALSVAIVLPAALLVMACSAISKTTGLASVIACALLFMNGAFANALAEILRNHNLRCLSLIRSMVYLGDVLFDSRTRITLHWGWAAAGMTAFCILCAIIVLGRIRRVEIGS